MNIQYISVYVNGIIAVTGLFIDGRVKSIAIASSATLSCLFGL
ncbi:hypothetical protein TPY_2836 [Sulfobacillus acidophilus TPY]|nr:hypothetical protein TPY_2836 [Sulfobacillus acidophilus TPY]